MNKKNELSFILAKTLEHKSKTDSLSLLKLSRHDFDATDFMKKIFAHGDGVKKNLNFDCKNEYLKNHRGSSSVVFSIRAYG